MLDPIQHNKKVRVDLKRLERLEELTKQRERIKTEYIKDLKTRVTFPDLLADNPKMWTRVIDMALPEASRRTGPEYVEFQRLLSLYQTGFTTSQHEYNLFVGFLIIDAMCFTDVDRWFLKGKPTEYYMGRFDVDLPTALKMKSLRDQEIIIEPIWESIK